MPVVFSDLYDWPRSQANAAPVPLDPLLVDILQALHDIKPDGSFAGHASLNSPDFADLLGLHVEGLGPVTAPLKAPEARKLIKLCRQAPFGKGTETLIDTSVRNTWELDASKLQFSNPDGWARTVDQCVAFARKALGITSPIIADPYKMLIYEKGALFKPHTDTEKIPGMFGTLVICLPSAHKGGDLVVRHRGEEKTYKTSDVQPSVLCWYSDVHHEVLPVTSGYRWVLTYNLAISPDLERPSAALLQPDTGKLKQSLARWLGHLAQKEPARVEIKDTDAGDQVYFLLEHEYTEASIALRALKTTDIARVQCLRDLSAKLGFDLFLGVLEKQVFGGTETDFGKRGRKKPKVLWHEHTEIYDTTVSFKKLVDLDGNVLRSGMEIGPDDLKSFIPQGDPFEGVGDRNEDYEGYTGNAGFTARHFYRTAVAVLVPHSSRDRFLTRSLKSRGDQTVHTMLRQYTTKCLDPELEPTWRQSAVETMGRLARKAWGPKSSDGRPDADTALDVLRVALEYRDYDLVNHVLDCPGAITVPDLAFAPIKNLALSGRIDVSRIKKSMLDNILRRDLPSRAVCVGFLRPSEHETNADLEALAVEVADQSLNQLGKDLMSSMLVQANPMRRVIQANDGYAIISMTNRTWDYDLFKTRVFPTLWTRLSTSASFVLGAVRALETCVSENVFPRAETLDMKQLSELAISVLDVTKFRTKAALLAQQPIGYYDDFPKLSPTQLAMVTDPAVLADFFKTCLNHGWDDLLEATSLKIVAQVASIPPVEFNPFWIPFLDALFQILHPSAPSGPVSGGESNPNPNPITNPPPPPTTSPPSPTYYKTLTLTLLQAYHTRSIGAQPPQTASLTLPHATCLPTSYSYSIYAGADDDGDVDCRDCPALNAFLTHPSQRVACFALTKARRQHLHCVLDESPAKGLVRHETERGGGGGGSRRWW